MMNQVSHGVNAVFGRILVGNKAIFFALLFAAVLSVASPYFLTSANLFTLFEQIVVMTVVALGYTVLLGTGEIDLSIGSIVGLTGIVMAKLMVDAQWPILAAVLMGVAVGALCGAINATLISAFGLPPFIVTLATNALFTGAIYITTNLVPISGLPEAFIAIARQRVGPVPMPVLILIPIVATFLILARHSVFGAHVIALGGSPEAVRVSGINIRRLRLKVYIIVGICCAIAAMLLTARSASAQINAGANLMLLVIAAVVIGGTPLLGGKMDMLGTVFGCLIIGMISNGLNLLGFNPNFQIITQGLLILLALIVDVQSTKLMLSMAKRQMLRERGAHP